MRILALAAAATMSLAPTLSMAQGPANSVLVNGVYECSPGFSLGAGGACLPANAAGPDVIVAVDAGGTARAGLPILGSIPPGALVVGGLVLLAGTIIGIAAATDDDSSTSTTTTN